MRAKIKKSYKNLFSELYRIVLMDGRPLAEITGKMLDFASGHQLSFPFEADRQLAFFIFKYYNGDMKKLIIRT